jgi:hypothetical protein
VPERSTRDLRRFGLVVAAGFLLIGIISWLRGHTIAPAALWTVAAAMGLAGLLVPRALGPVERVWLRVGAVLAWVNTRIILSALFYLVLTPIGLLMRPFRDPLARQRDASAGSYWLRRSASPGSTSADYERQF